MYQLISYITSLPSTFILSYTLLFLRLAMGIIMIFHGFPKLLAGKNQWRFLGSTMKNVGINCMPIFWGLCAALTEFLGGISLILGLGTRVACLFLIFTMIVALLMHLKNRDSYATYSHAITLLVIFTTFFVIGSGIYSLDYYFTH